jgi:hypothetical protein
MPRPRRETTWLRVTGLRAIRARSSSAASFVCSGRRRLGSSAPLRERQVAAVASREVFEGDRRGGQLPLGSLLADHTDHLDADALEGHAEIHDAFRRPFLEQNTAHPFVLPVGQDGPRQEQRVAASRVQQLERALDEEGAGVELAAGCAVTRGEGAPLASVERRALHAQVGGIRQNGVEAQGQGGEQGVGLERVMSLLAARFAGGRVAIHAEDRGARIRHDGAGCPKKGSVSAGRVDDLQRGSRVEQRPQRQLGEAQRDWRGRVEAPLGLADEPQLELGGRHRPRRPTAQTRRQGPRDPPNLTNGTLRPPKPSAKYPRLRWVHGAHLAAGCRSSASWRSSTSC